jgi:hypothetical protein
VVEQASTKTNTPPNRPPSSQATSHEKNSLYFQPKIGYNTPGLPPLGAEDIADDTRESSQLNTTYAIPITQHEIRDTRCEIRTKFVQNKPNLHKPRIYLNLFYEKGLRRKSQILRPKSKPKQTQTKPIRPPFFARYGTPNPIFSQTGESISRCETLPNPPEYPCLPGFEGD